MPVRQQTAIRAALTALAAALAGLIAAPAAWGANESISGTVTSAGGAPLAGMCVTAEALGGDVLRTTASDGSYTIPVAPGDYLVRFDDCGISAYATEYWQGAFDQGSATTVTVATDQQRTGIDASLDPLPPDDGAPETSIVTGPPEAPATTPDTGVTFEFNSPDDPGASFECSFDGGSFEPCSSPQSYNSLGDGPHHFEVRAVDFLGNRDLTPDSLDFVVDSAAPDGFITAGPEGTIETRDVIFEFSSDDPENSGYFCKLDDRGAEPCTSPQGYTGLDNGPHTFVLRARDQNGNTDQTPAIRSFYVNVNGPEDLDPPATTITDGPAGTISTTGTAFSFESDEDGSTFECQLDGGPFEPCQSPRIVSGLTNGEHTFGVRATDPAGNVEPVPVTRTFTVDTTLDTVPPDTEIASGPTGTVGQTFASFSFTSTEGNSTFECSLDGAAFTICTSPRTYTGLADGPHTFEVRARDAADNVDASPASTTFTVDSSLPPDLDAPQTTINAGPDAPIATRSASFGFESTEAGSSFECRLDGGSWRRCINPRSYTGLADGPHTFEVRATDPAGNRDTTPDSRTFSVDATAPNTTISGGPDGLTINTASPVYSFTSSEGGVTFECRLDAGLWQSCASPHAMSGVSEGTHTFAVRATDAVGNVDGTPAISGFTVDTTAPQTIIDDAPTGTVRNVAPIQFHADEPSFFDCRIDGGSWEACNSPWDPGALGQGSHTIEIRATDSAGNVDQTPASRTFAIDSVAPDTTIASGPSGTIGTTSASFSFAAGEPGSSFQCQMDGAGWGPCSSPQAYSGLAQGSHTFQVRATDAAGNVDGSPATRAFTVDTVAPNTTIASGPSGTITATSASFSFSAGESGSSFQCRLDGSSWSPCTSPQSYSDLSEGGHTFEVRAADGIGNQDASPASRTFAVDLPSEPPPTSPPPTGPGPECAAAQDKLDAAQAALKKAKKKLKKAKSAGAKKRAKKKVKKAKANVRKAQTTVASSC